MNLKKLIIYDSRNYWGLTDMLLWAAPAPSTIVEITEVLQTSGIYPGNDDLR